VHGRLDVSGPPDIAWHLAQTWPGCELVLVDEAGHGSRDPGMTEALIAATNRFAPRHPRQLADWMKIDSAGRPDAISNSAVSRVRVASRLGSCRVVMA
jgi:hypothetical protein